MLSAAVAENKTTVLRFCFPNTQISQVPRSGNNIIDFPNLGSTYNGGWCTATKLDETLISRPSREVNVNRERVRCYGAVYLSSNQMLE